TSSGSINNIKIHNGYLFAAGSLNSLVNNTDYLMIASDLSSNVQWTARYNSQSNDYNDLASLAFDNDGNVLVSGRTEKAGTTDYYTTTIKYGHSANNTPSVSEDDVSFQVFPNPASDNINLLSSSPSTKINSMLIRDEWGRKIKEVVLIGTRENQIDIRDFPSGIYFLKIKTKDGKLFS